MNDFQNNQDTYEYESYSQGNDEEKRPVIIDGIRYKGEKTDFRFDPGAAVKKSWIVYNKPEQLDIEDKKTEQRNIAFISKNTQPVQSETEKIPSNKGYAERVGFKVHDALALAIEHYASTEKYIRNMEEEAAAEEEDYED